MPTFAGFFERWDKESFSRECAPKTAERYRELGQYAIRLFGDMPLDQLSTMQLSGHLNRLSDSGGRQTKSHPQGRPLAPKTVRHIAFLVQDCLEQAVDWDLINKNPMKKVKKPKVPRRRPKVEATSARCLRPRRLATSARVERSASESRSRPVTWERRTRFSAIKYSH